MVARWLRLSLVLALLIGAVQSSGDGGDTRHWCGTSEQTIEATRTLSSWVASRERMSEKRTTLSVVEQSGDLFILDPDEFLVPFDNPVDLAGRTITFVPESSSTYRVTQTSLNYDTSVGTSRPMPSTGDNDFVVHRLASFVFPFQGRSVRDLYISERFGVFLASPPGGGGRSQLGPLDIATPRHAVIAPYLQPGLPRTLVRTTREVFVRETQDEVTITWRALVNTSPSYNPLNDGALDIQMVLRENGEIRFSYRTLTNIAWGSVVITSGEEPQRASLDLLASLNDTAGDVNQSLPLSNLLDIRQVQIHRVGDTELIRVKVQLGGRLFPEVLSRQVFVRLVFDNGTNMTLNVNRSVWRYCVPGWGCSSSGGNVEFVDDGVVMYVLDRYLGESFSFAAETFSTQRVDFASDSLTLERGDAVDVDLTALSSGAVVASPVLEAFTVPVLNPNGVWERIREQFGLWDEEVDGVAIYQNFTTDIRTYATAYSTVGNSGADGVWAMSERYYGSDVPRRPALLHMNEVEPLRRDTASLRYRDFLLGHELGHRWLYGFNIAQDGQPTFVLGPDGGHPAQYVHTPAAFPVFTNRDYSVMGGSNFDDLGSGQYRTPEQIGPFGYSWHELYLIGLAAPEEVESWFYLAETQPRLGDVYHPPLATTVTGQRVEVGLPQMLQTMGARHPAHDESQRTFRVLFVLLDKPGSDSAEDEAILAEYAARFPGYFSNATGGRGLVTMSLPIAPVAQFQSPARAFTGQSIQFRDTSSDYPALWFWDFGDGASSTDQVPRHAYRSPGTYTVTLRVENSRGRSTTMQSITIEPAPRRRPGRR